MRTWPDMYELIGQWSRDNFGGQESKRVPGLVLGSIAPLLGMIEETYEYADASLGEDYEDGKASPEVYDAISDQLIFLIDYMNREHMSPYLFTRMEEPSCEFGNLGKLVQLTLKYHQGIRGVTSDEYVARREEYCYGYFCELRVEAESRGLDLLEMVNTTWENVVAKRSWINPTPH